MVSLTHTSRTRLPIANNNIILRNTQTPVTTLYHSIPCIIIYLQSNIGSCDLTGMDHRVLQRTQEQSIHNGQRYDGGCHGTFQNQLQTQDRWPVWDGDIRIRPADKGIQTLFHWGQSGRAVFQLDAARRNDRHPIRATKDTGFFLLVRRSQNIKGIPPVHVVCTLLPVPGWGAVVGGVEARLRCDQGGRRGHWVLRGAGIRSIVCSPGAGRVQGGQGRLAGRMQ